MPKRKVKPKKLNEVQKLRRDLRKAREAANHFTEMSKRNFDYFQSEKEMRKQDNKQHEERYQLLNREKEQHYRESNQKTAKISRLERAVTSLKEGMQKTLLAFDVLN